VKATWFYVIGVVNADGLNQGSRILDPAVKTFAEDGRILVLDSTLSTEELTTGTASAEAVQAITRLLDWTQDPRWQGWLRRLRDEARKEAEAAGVVVTVEGEEVGEIDSPEAQVMRQPAWSRAYAERAAMLQQIGGKGTTT
jgi:hypothetical protein